MTTSTKPLVQRTEVDRLTRMRQNVLIMWESISNIFSRSGGKSETEDHAADTGLRRLWIALVRLGMARRLTLQDAEDLAQESIVAGMESFDPARGDFSAFCKTIMANRAKNHHRDKRPHEPIPDDGGSFVDPSDGPGWANYHNQCRAKADRILANTVSSLKEEEAKFFEVLAEVHSESSHGEVSEAARRAGITPQKGWDIFRKIQRRFKHLDRQILLPTPPPVRASHDAGTRFSLGPCVESPPYSEGQAPLSDIPSSEGKLFDHLVARYRHFSFNLAADCRRRLHSLLRN